MSQSFSERLLAWYDQHGRTHLPWQKDISPYRVWVSEIMLQQTQVATVIPYFERFLIAFPSIASLAESTEDSVLHHWTGLGYYARGRNLRNAAIKVTGEYHGELPLDVDTLMTLPGIGRSTAGAIVAICTNRKATILDGNVKRVLTRYLAIEGWPGNAAVAKKLWRLAEEHTPDQRVANYTQAIMDLGATLCTRSSPACERCPLAKDCIALATRRIAGLPGKKPRKKIPIRPTSMLVIENPLGEWLLQQRPSNGLWGGLWSFPEGEATDMLSMLNIPEDHILEQRTLTPFRHTFTHFHMDITPIHIRLTKSPEGIEEGNRRWYSHGSTDEIGLTRPVSILLEATGLTAT